MPNPIQADKFVTEAMDSKGISQAIGVYGEHKIRLGKKSPLRLDEIKANSVPFAGFRAATKVASGQQGVRNCVADTLKYLSRPDGKFDAKHLLGAVKAGSIHLDRLERLRKLPLQAQNAPHMWMFADAVKKLSNNDLAAIYQTFVSPHMDLLQTALQREGQINPQAADARYAAEQLFDLQALVLKEVSDRVAVERELPGANELPSMGERLGGDGALVMPGNTLSAQEEMTPANTLTLVETAAQSSTTRERTAQAVKAEMGARQLPHISARVIGNVLRSAELTINMRLEGLLSEQSLLRHPDKPKTNIFHLAQDGNNLKGDAYIMRRDATEKNLFPELAARPGDNPSAGDLIDNMNADERPTYGALNLSLQDTGAASPMEYGPVVIVLKPHVAQRATYTVDDTFFNQPLNFSPERRKNFERLLDSLVGTQLEAIDESSGELKSTVLFTKEDADKLKNTEGPEYRLLEKFFDTHAQTPTPIAKLHDVLFKLGFATQAREDLMTTFMLKVFGDPALSRSRTATYDNLEALVPGMRTDTSNSLAFMAQQRARGAAMCSLSGTGYIEAQVHGPLIPSRDIAEIRYSSAELENMTEETRHAMLNLLKNFHKATGVPVKAISTQTAEAQSDALQEARDKFGAFHVEHLDRAKLNEVAERYQNNMEEYLKRALQGRPKMAALLPENESPVRGRALEKLKAAFQREFEAASAEITDSPYTEEDMAATAFDKVVSEVLRDKEQLLLAMEPLPFDNPSQKTAFRNWVLSAGALKNPKEMVFIHKQARAFAERLMAMLNAQPAPDAATIFQAMSKAHDEIARALPELADSLGEGAFAPDDKATEFARVAFMSHALIQHADDNGSANLLRLRQILDSAEVRHVLSQLETLKGLHGELELPEDAASLLGGLSYLEQNMRELESSTKLAWEEPRAFLGNPAMMPPETWHIMESLAPATTGVIRAAYPPYEAFPVPANPAQLPANDAQRRDFLIRHLNTYINHEQTFERGSSVHGRGHITRAYIYATAMCNMLEAQGLHPDRNAVLCGIAGHDVGRLRGGEDRWEGRSAAMTIKAMREDFGGARADDNNSAERLDQVLNTEKCEARESPHSLGLVYETALARCIDSHRGKTLESMLLNAADSLDIGRVAEFDMNKFEFLKDSIREEKAEEIREQLAREADILQRLTNPLCSLRNSIAALQVQIRDTDNFDLADLLQGQMHDIYARISNAFAEEWTQTNEQFVRSFEDVLRGSSHLLPLLSRYYFRENAA